MPSKLPQFTIRADKNLLDKLAYIAKKNERSASKEAIYLIKKRIEEYESEHGEIIIDPTTE